MVGTCISYHCKVVTVDNLNDIRDVPSLQLQLDGGRRCFGLRRAWLDDHAGGTPPVTRAVLSVLVLRTDPRWSSRGSVLPLAMAAVFPLSVVLADSPTLAGSTSHLWNLFGPSALLLGAVDVASDVPRMRTDLAKQDQGGGPRGRHPPQARVRLHNVLRDVLQVQELARARSRRAPQATAGPRARHGSGASCSGGPQCCVCRRRFCGWTITRSSTRRT